MRSKELQEIHLLLNRIIINQEEQQGLILLLLKRDKTIMAKLDDITKQINDETDAIAARIDALNLKVGDTVTQAQFDALQAVSVRLGVLGSDPANPIPAPVDPTPAA